MMGLLQDGLASGRYGTFADLEAFVKNDPSFDNFHRYRSTSIGTPEPFSSLLILDFLTSIAYSGDVSVLKHYSCRTATPESFALLEETLTSATFLVSLTHSYLFDRSSPQY